MAVLEAEKYNNVIDFGKKAISSLKENNLDRFSVLAEEGWNCFPEPKNNWNQGYNYAKMVYKGFFSHKQFDQAKIWLNRMIENNNTLNLFDEDVWFETAKYQFETADYKESYNKLKQVVEVAGFRYFENEDPKYLEFYKNPEKYFE